jgi:hypothetical protein
VNKGRCIIAVLFNARLVKSSGVLLIGDHFRYLNLRHALGVKVISASGLAGAQIDGRQVAIDADDSVDRVQISAEPFGAILTAWTNSSTVLPGRS